MYNDKNFIQLKKKKFKYFLFQKWVIWIFFITIHRLNLLNLAWKSALSAITIYSTDRIAARE